MSAVPLSDPAAKRRIGDILLAHGFVTAEQLTEATEEQERTQQPLGQILVQQGSITRLELASALAEQWSEPSASISSAPRIAPPAAPAVAPSAQEEAQYAARLQEAVADLARRVQSTEPLEGLDARVEELSRRVESTLARTQHIEAAVATLAESFEGVTTGVEEAFYALQTGAAELAGNLVRIESTVSELATRAVEAPADDPQALAAIEELAGRLDTLGDASRSLSEMEARVEHLAAQLESLADTTTIEELRGSIRVLEESSGAVPGLAERLDRVEAAAGEEFLSVDLAAQAATLEELQTIVAELGARPVGTPELDERLLRIEARLEEAGVSQASLTTLVDRFEERLAEPRDDDPRIDELGARIEDVASRLDATNASVESRLDGAYADSESRLDAARADIEDLRSRVSARQEPLVDARVDDLMQAFQLLRTELADLAAAAQPDDGLGRRLDLLEVRIGELMQEERRTDALTARLREVEARLAPGIVTPEDLARIVVELPRDETDLTDLSARIEAHEALLGEGLAELSTDLATLRLELGELGTSEPREENTVRFAELEGHIEALAIGLPEHAALTTRLDALETARAGDLDTVDVLARALDRIRHDLTTAPDPPAAAGVDVADAVAWISQRLDALEEARAAAPPPGLDPTELVGELERFRLVIERVGLHLGEHDRALADLAPIRMIPLRLDEISARVEELAESGRAAPGEIGRDPSTPGFGDVSALLRRVEEAESASQSDAEKLMNRLERMASSIDWRLQRLEADETE